MYRELKTTPMDMFNVSGNQAVHNQSAAIFERRSNGIVVLRCSGALRPDEMGIVLNGARDAFRREQLAHSRMRHLWA